MGRIVLQQAIFPRFWAFPKQGTYQFQKRNKNPQTKIKAIKSLLHQRSHWYLSLDSLSWTTKSFNFIKSRVEQKSNGRRWPSRAIKGFFILPTPNNTQFQGKWLEVIKNHRCNNGKTLVNYNVQTPLTKKPLASSILGNKSTLNFGNSTPQALRVLPIWDGCDAPRDPVAKRDGGWEGLRPADIYMRSSKWSCGPCIFVSVLQNCYKVLYSSNMLLLPSIVGGTLFRNQSTNTWQRGFYSPI